MFLHFDGSFCTVHLKTVNNDFISILSVESGLGKLLSFSYASSHLTPSCIIKVASPPSSTIRLGPSLSGHDNACYVHHHYSGIVSPFHAKTFDDSDFAIAAAA